MNNEESKAQNFKSFGDWIICSSNKMKPGKQYYFNTLTRESVWELSSTEKDKARKATSNGGDFQSISFPEPAEPPEFREPNHKSHQSSSGQQSTMHDIQTVNMSIPNQCNTMEILASSNQSNNPLIIPESVSYPMSTTVSTNFNPRVWTVPPIQPIFLAPMRALTDQVVNPVFNYENVVHSVPIRGSMGTNRFNLFDLYCNGRFQRKFQRFVPNWRKNYRHNYHHGFKRNSNHQPPVSDLREQLTRKRRFSEGGNLKHFNDHDEVSHPRDFNSQGNANDPNENTIKKEELHEESDDEWLEENMEVIGASLALDLTPLKKLSQENVESTWYIVANTDVLLNNLLFVSNIVNSDEHCHLATPQFVLSELETVSRVGTSKLKAHARRAAHLMRKYEEASCLLIGDESHDIKIMRNKVLLDFCLQLKDLNHFVVLLSNDETLQEENTNIPIFSVVKLKEYLARHAQYNMRNLERIQVVVNNSRHNISTDSEQSHSGTVAIASPPTRDSELQTCDLHLPSTSRTSISNDNMSYIIGKTGKISMSVQVQTDFETTHSKKEQSYFIGNEEPTDVNQKKYPGQTFTQTSSASMNFKKGREIKLNRNPVNIQKSTEDNRKRFRWRRKRTCSETATTTEWNTDSNQSSNNASTSVLIPIDDINETETANTISDLNTRDLNTVEENEEVNDKYVDNYYNEEAETRLSDESDSCQLIMNRRVSSEGITIEETSSSDTSSSTSSAGSEPLCDVVQAENESNETDYIQLNEPGLDQSIMNGWDEWISRFVQIMEEVLTQVLHREPPFVDPGMPPPWTLYEATKCIQYKFENNEYVVSVADVLSETLNSMEADKGKISTIDPREYLNMFSDGITLVQALKSVDNCEDLEAAMERLTNLLIDIQQASSNEITDFSDPDIDEQPVQVIESSDSSRQEFTKPVQKESQVITPKVVEKPQKPHPESPVVEIDGMLELQARPSFPNENVKIQNIPGLKITRTVNNIPQNNKNLPSTSQTLLSHNVNANKKPLSQRWASMAAPESMQFLHKKFDPQNEKQSISSNILKQSRATVSKTIVDDEHKYLTVTNDNKRQLRPTTPEISTEDNYDYVTVTKDRQNTPGRSLRGSSPTTPETSTEEYVTVTKDKQKIPKRNSRHLRPTTPETSTEDLHEYVTVTKDKQNTSRKMLRETKASTAETSTDDHSERYTVTKNDQNTPGKSLRYRRVSSDEVSTGTQHEYVAVTKDKPNTLKKVVRQATPTTTETSTEDVAVTKNKQNTTRKKLRQSVPTSPVTSTDIAFTKDNQNTSRKILQSMASTTEASSDDHNERVTVTKNIQNSTRKSLRHIRVSPAETSTEAQVEYVADTKHKPNTPKKIVKEALPTAADTSTEGHHENITVTKDVNNRANEVRKIGRRRKSIINDSGLDGLTSSVSISTENTVAQNDKTVIESTSIQEMGTNQVNELRKRGRPRKTVSINDSEQNDPASSVSINTQNAIARNDATVIESTSKQEMSASQVNEVRKRGRPRKNVTINNSGQNGPTISVSISNQVTATQDNNNSMDAISTQEITEPQHFLSFLQLRRTDSASSNELLSNESVSNNNQKHLLLEASDNNVIEKRERKEDTGPKIIRKFTTCPAVEKKLRMRNESLNLDALDYNYDINDYDENDQCNTSGNEEQTQTGTDDQSQYDKNISCAVENQDFHGDNQEVEGENEDSNGRVDGDVEECADHDELDKLEYETQSEDIYKLDAVFKACFSSIKESYVNVQNFCIHVQESKELRGSNKRKVQETASKCVTHLKAIVEDLKSRADPSTEAEKLKLMLRKSGLEKATPSSSQWEQYRYLLSVTIKEGNNLLETLKCILDITRN